MPPPSLFAVALFAADEMPQWLPYLLTGGGAVAITQVANWLKDVVKQYLDRREKERGVNDEREDKEEETALARLKEVMEMREQDCTKRIDELTRRVEGLERTGDAGRVERDVLRDKVASYIGRNKYLEFVLKRAGITPDDWDKPDTADALPAVNLPSKGDKP